MVIRKILLIAISLVIVGGVALWWLGDRAIKKDAAGQLAEETSFTNDEDGDNLAGWEEDLWRTDRLKPDTDGDGTSDGEEVRLGRDPRKAGPNDEFSEPADQAIIVASKVVAERQAPLARLDQGALAKRAYTLTDLSLTLNESVKTAGDYRATVNGIIEDYIKHLPGDENVAMYQVLENEDTEALALINRSRQNIQSTVSRLLLTKTPLSVSLLHLNLVNSLASLGQIIYNMAQVTSEPLLATESAELRPQKYLGVVSSLTALKRHLAKPPLQ